MENAYDITSTSDLITYWEKKKRYFYNMQQYFPIGKKNKIQKVNFIPVLKDLTVCLHK